jgi:hypothetical protein
MELSEKGGKSPEPEPGRGGNMFCFSVLILGRREDDQKLILFRR